MIADMAAAPQLDTVVVCHREPLIGAATAALIEGRGIARHVVVVNSAAHLLSRLGRAVEIAVVFDSVSEDISDLFEAMDHRGLSTPILVISRSADASYAAKVLEAGAAGFVFAWCGLQELQASILDARQGRIVIPASERAEILEALRVRRLQRLVARRILAQLTPLDVRILRSLCDGMTVVRIAERMLLSPHTVRGRMRAIGSAVGARGQLGIAAVGRHLLADARLPLGAEESPTRAQEAGRANLTRGYISRLS